MKICHITSVKLRKCIFWSTFPVCSRPSCFPLCIPVNCPFGADIPVIRMGFSPHDKGKCSVLFQNTTCICTVFYRIVLVYTDRKCESKTIFRYRGVSTVLTCQNGRFRLRCNHIQIFLLCRFLCYRGHIRKAVSTVICRIIQTFYSCNLNAATIPVLHTHSILNRQCFKNQCWGLVRCRIDSGRSFSTFYLMFCQTQFYGIPVFIQNIQNCFYFCIIRNF